MVVRVTFDQVEKEFGALIRRIAISYEADRGAAEELVQDIHFALWLALPSFRGKSSMRTFVARIATNRAVSHVRRSVRSPLSVELSEDLPAGESTPEHRAIAEDQQARLIAAVRALPLSLWQVALLTLEGLVPAEISDVLGISANAVAIRLSRARDTLRRKLEVKNDRTKKPVLG
jgi:RNA polymerase sigma-70 factor (ECF subfamily)